MLNSLIQRHVTSPGYSVYHFNILYRLYRYAFSIITNQSLQSNNSLNNPLDLNPYSASIDTHHTVRYYAAHIEKFQPKTPSTAARNLRDKLGWKG